VDAARLLLMALSGRSSSWTSTSQSNARHAQSPTGGSMMQSEWISTTQATRVLGVTASTLYRLINDGTIRAYRFGRVIRLRASDLDAYLATARPTRRRGDHR
jgi:excisionase family DNA binding protein